MTLRSLFEISHGNRTPILAMEGMRGVAVVLVFFVHFVTLTEGWVLAGSATESVAWALRRFGNTGVDLFFVLSGFLIYGTLIERSRPFIGFMRRRLVRIYPTFLVVFAVYIVLSVLRPDRSRIPEEALAASVYVVQNLLLLPGIFDIEPIITVAWSLSYEVFYYLLIPVVIGLLGLRRWSRSARVIFFSVAAALWLLVSDQLTGDSIRLVMFVAGILLKEAMDAGLGRRAGPLGAPAMILTVLAVLVGDHHGLGGQWRFMSLFIGYFTLCLAAFGSDSATSRLLSWAPLRWLGNMSYSYYLLHGLVLVVLAVPLGALMDDSPFGTAAFWWLLAPAFLATLVPSALLFVFVERRFSLHAKGSGPVPKPAGALERP